MSPNDRIVLDEADFAEEAQATTLPPAAPPTQLPPIARREPIAVGSAPVGQVAGKTPTTSGPVILSDPRKAPLIAAAISVFVGWALAEAFGIVAISATTSAGLDAVAGLWVGLVGAIFGGAMLTFDRAFAGAWEEAGRRFVSALLPMAAIGFLSGFLANALYITILKNANLDFTSTGNEFAFYLARCLGWALFGAGVGGMVGVMTKSHDRAINGAVGGAAGGAIGGLIFQFVGVNLQFSQSILRLLGLLSIGVLIALAMRVIEEVRRDAWLHIVAGGMAGKEFILYDAVTHIGSSPGCEIYLLKDADVDVDHARIDEVGGQRRLVATSSAPTYVNDAQVTDHVLRDGDRIRLGHTTIAYSERAAQSTAATAQQTTH